MATLTRHAWGSLPTGEEVDLFTLRNAQGVETSITNLGGRIVTLKTPDRNGHFADVVLGFDALESYTVKNPYFGALVGRYANRIAGGKFSLNGEQYQLEKNNGENALHGGPKGFDKVVWKADADNEGRLSLQYISKDGEEGYPGTLHVTVVYTLGDDNSLSIEYRALTDKPTVLNLTNHSYFNLAGHGHGSIIDHEVQIQANQFTPVNEHLIPTGELRDVFGTPFDFVGGRRLGDGIDADNEQIKLGGGYDHNFVLNSKGFRTAATLREPRSGRTMEVKTTQPGMQLYSGNHLPERIVGKGGAVYGFRSGVCFETQHFPDSPNQPEFPTTVLEPSLGYHQATQFKFSAD